MGPTSEQPDGGYAIAALTAAERTVEELKSMLGAPDPASGPRGIAPGNGGPSQLELEIERALGAYDRFGHSFALMLVALPCDPAPVGPGTFAGSRAAAASRAGIQALGAELRAVDRLFEAGPATLAVLLAGCDAEGAARAVARLAEALDPVRAPSDIRAAAVSFPDDGVDPATLLDEAWRRLEEATGETPATTEDRPEQLSA